MFIKKGQLPLLIVIGIALIYFFVVFIRLQNYEFLTYVGVILFFMVLVLLVRPSGSSL